MISKATLKKILFPVAIAWSAVNVVAVGFAALGAEAIHASVHGALAVVFAVWAYWLRQKPRAQLPDPQLETLQDQVSDLQRQLSETQQGLDFAERLLQQKPEARELDALRYAPKKSDDGSGSNHPH